MINLKKITVFVTAFSLCVSLCSCGGLTSEQKKAAEEAGISVKRYCTDTTEINEKTSALLAQYYEGMSEADHNKCFNAFPYFYKEAVEAENAEYGETNDEYIQSIRDGFISTYGDDFYAFAEINNILQINDESLYELEDRIWNAFEVECELDDLYYVYFTENIRGSLDKQSQPLEFAVLKIDGKYYLYDDYYEPYEEETTETE